MKLLHLKIRGLTASFRHPVSISGFQITLQTPLYPTLLGLLSCCAGRQVLPEETKIGFNFHHKGIGKDLERIQRWSLTNNKAKVNSKGPAIRTREFLLAPSLDLYLSNLNFHKIMESPQGIPVLGRSQDIAWIDKIEEINVSPIKNGKVAGTLIPLTKLKSKTPNGFLMRLPEIMSYSQRARMRKVEKSTIFLMTQSEGNQVTPIEMEKDLFIHSNSTTDQNHSIYLHSFE